MGGTGDAPANGPTASQHVPPQLAATQGPRARDQQYAYPVLKAGAALVTRDVLLAHLVTQPRNCTTSCTTSGGVAAAAGGATQ